MDRPTLLHQLAEEICAISADHPIRVAIDGLDAAGKTTLGDELGQVIHATGRQVIRASIDGFHHPQSTRYRRGRFSPEGYFLDSFDYETLTGHLLIPLGPGGSRRYRSASFDYLTDTPLDSQGELAAKDAVLLFDGVFVLRPEILPLWDYSIYLYITPEEALKRALRRDSAGFGGPEKVRERYQARYFPAHESYILACRPYQNASRVVDNEDPGKPYFRAGA